MAGEAGFINVSLQGESLPTDINAVLTPDTNHDFSTFVDQIEHAVQSMQTWDAILLCSYACQWYVTETEGAGGN